MYVYDGLFKKSNWIDSNKQNIEKKIEGVDKKISDNSKLIETHEFNRLTEINFNARMVEASEKLATNGLGSGNKNREKIRKSSNVWYKFFYR